MSLREGKPAHERQSNSQRVQSLQNIFQKDVDRNYVIVYITTMITKTTLSRRTSPSRAGVVTIREVAVEARVSTATVSRVLSVQDGVGKRVRERVLAAVRKLDYHPNRLARGLRAGLRKVIGGIIPDLQNPVF